MERHVKIIATIGPASSDAKTLSAMMQAGMNVARLNFSHGTHEEHRQAYETIRAVASRLDRPIAIMADLSGPKIRVGIMPGDGMQLDSGDTVYIKSPNTKIPQSSHYDKVLTIKIPKLTSAFKPGNRILMDDGNLELQVETIENNLIKTSVVTGGLLKSHKGVNLPGAKLSINPLTEKDLLDLTFAVQLGVDAIAISFVRTSSDIIFARKMVAEAVNNPDSRIPIIAKIERPEAVDNLDAILEVTDGIMVARGDLGIETSTATVPIIQKSSIRKAATQSRFVITATQMLESMIENPRPTRAEASDIANAVFDGTDAVMLSGETAVGAYPVEVIRVMDEIVRTAEQHTEAWSICTGVSINDETDDAISICRAAKELAHDRNVACSAVFTLTGKTALYLI